MQGCLKEGFALNGPTVGRNIFLVLVLISVLGETILRSVHWGLIQDQGERTCGWGEWIDLTPDQGEERLEQLRCSLCPSLFVQKVGPPQGLVGGERSQQKLGVIEQG